MGSIYSLWVEYSDEELSTTRSWHLPRCASSCLVQMKWEHYLDILEGLHTNYFFEINILSLLSQCYYYSTGPSTAMIATTRVRLSAKCFRHNFQVLSLVLVFQVDTNGAEIRRERGGGNSAVFQRVGDFHSITPIRTQQQTEDYCIERSWHH